MMPALSLVATCLLFGDVGALTTLSDMACHDDTNYVNDWDGYHDNVQSAYFVSGQYSVHSNSKEDRRFKWRYCTPSPRAVPWRDTATLSETAYDSEWTRSCSTHNSGHSAMIGATSSHDNGKEDRRWRFRCGHLDTAKHQLGNCGYSRQVNSWDGVLNYDCPGNGVIRSIWSKHHNHYEDRLWKFECCQVTEAVMLAPMTCKEDANYVNDWDGYHDNVQSSYFVSGQYSVHDNGKEDRRFKWRYCTPSAGAVPWRDTTTLSETAFDAEWTRSCGSYNSGHSAMIGATSYHDNGKEDRRWKFRCGHLDTAKYNLANCGYTGQLNSWDGGLRYNCPGNGVIRSIWSRHDNGKEDRLWKFECCQLTKT